ncbi:MAG: glycosyltransferase family 39 protein [Anaerolineae bacterium]|nr:glycosyltransferase family 39 protein [Anaerolineae bacterium]MDW8172266.1 glycosyltransferase family 39 protein [Anaerolineae bacterium]
MLLRIKNHLPLIIVLLVASLMRLPLPSIVSTWTDEITLLSSAVDLVYNRQPVWIGNPVFVAFGQIRYHSPFTVYVTAVPYLFFQDPTSARLFYGVLNIAAIAALFKFTHVYFDQVAAFSAGLTLAVMPWAVYWGRIVWNPSVAPLFIAAWFYAVLRGYQEQQSQWQFLSWIFLSLIIQSQAAMVVLVGNHLFIVVLTIIIKRPKIMQFVVVQLVSLLVMFVTFLPWLYGLYSLEQGSLSHSHDDAITLEAPGFDLIRSIFMAFSSGYGHRSSLFASSANPANWWIPQDIQDILYAHLALILLGAIVLIYGFVNNWERIGNIWVVTVLLTPLLFVFVSDRILGDHYLMPITFAGPVVFGIGVDYLARLQITPKLVILKNLFLFLVVGAIIIVQCWLSLSLLDLHRRDSRFMPLFRITDTLDQWTNYASTDTFILETTAVELRFYHFERVFYWNTFPFLTLSAMLHVAKLCHLGGLILPP